MDKTNFHYYFWNNKKKNRRRKIIVQNNVGLHSIFETILFTIPGKYSTTT